MAFSSLLSLAISVAKKQQPLWPLMNISQYAAPYPSIYFFRVGTSISGFLLMLCSVSFWQHRKHPASTSLGLAPITIMGFFLSGLGLVGAGLISCFENNDVHTTLAMLMFVSEASIQFGNVFCHRYPEASSASRMWRAFGTVFLLMALVTTVLMASHAVPKVDYLISILEWTATGEILMWCWWYARQIDLCDSNNKTARRTSSGVVGKNLTRENNIDSNRTTYSFDDQLDEL